jgi:hypothetical protein
VRLRLIARPLGERSYLLSRNTPALMSQGCTCSVLIVVLPPPSGTSDVLVARFNSTGGVKYASQFRGGGEYGGDLVVDSNDNVYVTGFLSATMYAGPFTLLTTGTGASAFVLKLNTTGGEGGLNDRTARSLCPAGELALDGRLVMIGVNWAYALTSTVTAFGQGIALDTSSGDVYTAVRR